MLDINVLKKLENISVLVVEDDENTRVAIAQSLKFYCKKLVTASDGLSGFDAYFKDDFDIVVTDINLPKLNGLEMLDEIKKIAPHLISIVITSYDTNENILASINIGAYYYLRKPIKTQDLQTTIIMATNHLFSDKISFKNGYEYDFKERILYKNANIVQLTKIEARLFHLLVSNIDKTINYEMIESYVWGTKSMSSEALRMIVNKIRLKTDKAIIENFSGVGYKITRG